MEEIGSYWQWDIRTDDKNINTTKKTDCQDRRCEAEEYLDRKQGENTEGA